MIPITQRLNNYAPLILFGLGAISLEVAHEAPEALQCLIELYSHNGDSSSSVPGGIQADSSEMMRQKIFRSCSLLSRIDVLSQS